VRILVPVLSDKTVDQTFVSKVSQDASVAYLLLVLDAKSVHAMGFKASDIMSGREIVESLKEEIKKNKRLCSDIMEWGNTAEKIAQIAEMKQVHKIMLFNPRDNILFNTLVEDIQKMTRIPVEVIEAKKEE
jgi:hypothetical protein